MSEQPKITQEEQVERALEFRKSKRYPHFPPHASSALINGAVCHSGVFKWSAHSWVFVLKQQSQMSAHPVYQDTVRTDRGRGRELKILFPG